MKRPLPTLLPALLATSLAATGLRAADPAPAAPADTAPAAEVKLLPPSAPKAEAGEAKPAEPAPAAKPEPKPAAEKKNTREQREQAEIAAIQKKIARITAERDLLMAESGLRAETLRAELGKLNDERERAAARFSAEKEKITAAMEQQRLEAEKLALETELINKRLAYEDAKIRFETATATALEKREEALLKARNSLALEKLAASGNELRARETEMKLAKVTSDAELLRLDAKIRTFDRQEVASSLAPRESISYLKEPFDGKRLVISDRRIELNGPISYYTAEFVTERINYYNNLNPEHPIFLVIDSSPGGSVMAGIQILKAMESSKAPVYVVVKTFAASMAACITTLAEKSFAYPSTMLLHHQVSYGMMGNLRQQEEELEQAREWFRRLGGPIAKKMGITVEEFVKRMYEKNSTGDWQEFADKAQQLKWVDFIAEEIVETSQLKNPDFKYSSLPALPQLPSSEAAVAPAGSAGSSGATEQVDAQGRRYMRLPRLQPFDCYHLYDPQQYYRME